jgi:hypothetical protein
VKWLDSSASIFELFDLSIIVVNALSRKTNVAIKMKAWALSCGLGKEVKTDPVGPMKIIPQAWRVAGT